jgi:outer membrane receptor protein involved in Fe transport
MNRYLLSLLCGTALVFDAAAAKAQTTETQSGSQLQEIIVTARKREESLQRVPVAVAVVSGEAIRNNLASDLTKVGELAPQVSISQGGSGTGALITIRGISSASSDAGLDQSVAIEVDGIPLSRGQIISTSVFDMASVQVLQGPQALFFGKNSPAGVISLQSADPTGRFEGYGTAGYEFQADQAYFEGAVSGPLSDTFKARLAVRISDMKGFIHNNARPVTDILNPAVTIPGATWGDRGPNSKDYAGRLTLTWSPTNDFDAKFKLLVNQQKRNAGNATTEPFCINDQITPVLLGRVPLPDSDCQRNMEKAHASAAPQYAVNFPYGNNGVPYWKSSFTLASLNLNKKLDQVTLTSTTGYYNQTVRQMSVSDWSPFATIWASSKEGYRLFTQELRANTEFDGPFNVMVGGYYEHFNRPFFNAPDIFHVFNPAAGNYAVLEMASRTHGEYYSAFAQARWNILPNLELAGGARYSHDDKKFTMTNLTVGPSQVATAYPVGTPLDSHYKDDNVSPEVTLTWHPQADQTLYAAFKTGYKAGGVSNGFIVAKSATPENIQFQPEKSKGYEVGYKGSALDRRLRYDLTAYYYDYKNLQVVAYKVETISFVLQNAATARIQGIQGSADWLVSDELVFHGNFGLNQAKYRRFDDAPCYQGQTAADGCINAKQNLSGKYLLRAPKFTWMLGADYKPHLVDGWATNFSLSVSHSGSYQAATDYAPGGFQRPFWLLNASAHVGPADGRYELAVLGRNLTNSYYMLNTVGWSGSGNNNQYVGFFNRPREIAVQGTVRF